MLKDEKPVIMIGTSLGQVLRLVPEEKMTNTSFQWDDSLEMLGCAITTMTLIPMVKQHALTLGDDQGRVYVVLGNQILCDTTMSSRISCVTLHSLAGKL